MPKGTRIKLLLATSLLALVAAVVVVCTSRATGDAGEDEVAIDRATQSIGAAVARAIDSNSLDALPDVVQSAMRDSPGVLGVEVVPQHGAEAWRFGATDALEEAITANAPEVRKITLVTDQRPWGVVHVLFKPPPSDGSVLRPDRPAFWIILGLAIIVLPVLAAVRRHLDRSPNGPMAAAAERARHTLDALAEGVLLLDQRGRVVFANRSFCDTIGTESSALAGVPAAQLGWISADGSSAPDSLPWDAAVAARGVRLGLRRAADTLAFIVNCTPLFRRPGVLHGVLVTLDDVSELERGRAALQEARDAAQQAGEAKARFLAMMSHEIRTPLNGVCGSLQLLANTELRERQQKYVEAARFSSSTLLHLINDILDFSKIEAGKLELNPVDCDLKKCVHDTVRMMEQSARAKGLAFACEIAPGVAPRFLADPDRIRQIIVNLTNNAIKFTPSGSVTLRADVERDDQERQLLRFDLTDTGIGIPEEKKERLFKAFSQVDSSTSRHFGGTGLGLVISKQLCELMGGRIDVTSVEGKGTTFTFYLDLPRAPAGSTESVPDSAMNAGTADLSGLRILLAEDNPVGQMVVSDMLQGAGARCNAVGTGKDVLAALRSGSYDLVLMDCFMPETDGFEATREIRKLQHAGVLKGRLPVIALTAKAMRGDREACLEAGMDGYVTKPIDQDQLFRTIGAHTGRVAGTTAPADRPESRALDVDALRENYHGKLGLLEQLIQAFRDASAEDLSRIDSALTSRDAEALEHAAHRLAGGAGFVHADKAGELARTLERHGAERQVEGLASLAEQLRHEVRDAIQSLEQLTAPDARSEKTSS